MRSFKTYLLLGAAAMLGLTGCESSRSYSSGERSEGRKVDDHRITAEIKSELNHEPVYKFNDVDVKTFNGVVQLSGFVNTEDQKRRAAEVAQSVPGVTQVQNAISLKTESGPSPTGRTYGTNNPTYK
jgi:hyperosmotically inducible periplasmic protein